MNKELKELQSKLKKSQEEFDIATTCLVQALSSFNERMERVERWMFENQKKTVD